VAVAPTGRTGRRAPVYGHRQVGQGRAGRAGPAHWPGVA